MRNESAPIGLPYLQLIKMNENSTRDDYDRLSQTSSLHEEILSTIGTMLSALYQASTCHRECFGGPHAIEALAGRAHNLGSSALKLTAEGYYDEALILIRSLGEIANLVCLFSIDSTATSQWIKSDRKTRQANYSPASVRKALEQSDKISAYLNREWYQTLSNGYAHIVPGSVPNSHNLGDIGVVGSQYQERGVKTCTKFLFQALIILTFRIAAFFRYNDIIEMLKDHAKELEAVELSQDFIST